MLTTIAFVCVVIGVILLALGYTVEPRAIRPGWGLLIVALVLVVLVALLPMLATVHTATSLLGLR